MRWNICSLFNLREIDIVPIVYNIWRINQTITGFFEIGFKLTVNTDSLSLFIDNSTFRYKERSLWESGPLSILALLLSRFVVIVLFFDSLLFTDAITSGDSLLIVTMVTNSFSLLVVWVDREVVNDFPFFWSFDCNS